MAKHAEPASRSLNDSHPVGQESRPIEEYPAAKYDDPATGQRLEPDEAMDVSADDQAEKGVSRIRAAIAVGIAAAAALTGVAGWLGYRTYEARQAQEQRNEWVQAARQGAVNLTTIDHARVDDDIQRILDYSTGSFRDDFQKGHQPFVEVVKQTRSKSEGTVTAAGLESQDGDQAQVLVTVSVSTSTAGAPEQEPRAWRMRIGVQKTGDSAKVSAVQFVP